MKVHRGRRRVPVTGLVATIFAAASFVTVPAMSLAVTTPELFVQIGSCFRILDYTPSSAVTLELHAPDGGLRKRYTANADSTGRLDFPCASGPGRDVVPEMGDTIVVDAAGTANDKSMKLPLMTALADRVTDKVTGHAPRTGSFQVRTDCVLHSCTGIEISSIPVSANGTYAIDFTSGANNLNAHGGDKLSLRWFPGGNDLVLYDRSWPYIDVNIGDSRVDGAGDLRALDQVTFRTATDKVRGTARDVADHISGVLHFEVASSVGSRVVAQVGNKVSSDIASDAHFTIRNVDILANTAADTASVFCIPGQRFTIDAVNRAPLTPDTGSGGGTCEPDGRNDGVLIQNIDVQSGTTLTLTAVRGTGDRITRTVDVP